MKVRHIELEPGDDLRISFVGLWASCDVEIQHRRENRTVRIGKGERSAPAVEHMVFTSPIEPDR